MAARHLLSTQAGARVHPSNPSTRPPLHPGALLLGEAGVFDEHSRIDGPRAEVYALGALAYYALAGAPPFTVGEDDLDGLDDDVLEAPEQMPHT